ncbi:MAG TPA: ATP-dependent DNA helicase [Jatrophihabitans sp.]
MTEYRLVRPERVAPSPPVLDAAQRRVIEHEGGRLLVLAGPGTGKTTTLVETVVARVEAGVPVDEILMLTFGRKAAGELRDRVTARLGRTLREPLARTLHSYAFGVLRMAALRDAERPVPRLLGGADQDVMVRELLPGSDAALWPSSLKPALATYGFADELRDFMMRAIERGIDGNALRAEGARRSRADWIAIGAFLTEYEQINALDPSKGYDQAALIRAAINALHADPELLAAERAQRRRIYVDEYQDTDPAQAELLHLLATGADELILVGDPDQSIYAFRGANERAIAEVRDRFGAVDAVALATCRRFGDELLAATRRIAAKLPGRAEQRALTAAEGLPPGSVEVAVFRSAPEEAAYVADAVRRAGLGTDGTPPIPWSEMAVLVRATAPMALVHRALVAVGVPVALRREELPLAEQPIVAMLLDILSCAAGEPLTEDLAEALLMGPIGRADALRLRKLRRALLPFGPDASFAAVVSDERDAQVLPEYVKWPVVRVAKTLVAAKRAFDENGNAESILWAAWSASGLGVRLEAAALRSDPAAASANRDLDAVLQLFSAAADFVDRLPGVRPTGFADHLRAQQLPADAFARGSSSTEGVSILTAHASKGLEWEFVSIAGVQEGRWPDLRRRGSLLGVERLVDPDSDTVSSAHLLAEERRLFYVAATRAKSRLLATAVAGEEDQPSRFLDELSPAEQRGLTRLPHTSDRVGLIGHLRAVVCDPSRNADLRAEAAASLAELANAGIPGANPDDWWGLAELSTTEPVRAEDEPVYVSPSRMESFINCELRGLMDTIGVRGEQTSAASLGTVIHALAEQFALDELTTSPAELDALLDEQLAVLDFGAPWMAGNERARAKRMLQRLIGWLQSSRDAYDHVANELEFKVEVGGGVLAGKVDRLERDEDGRLVIVDFKTGKNSVKDDKLPEHPQLGAYQLAIEQGGFAEYGTESGGAMLVQLGVENKQAKEQRQPPLTDSVDPEWALAQVQQVVRAVRGSSFRAIANTRCNRCPVRASCPLQDDGRQVTQ